MYISSNPEQVDLSTVNLYDPRYYTTQDPHNAWRTMRESSPAHWFQVGHDLGFWALTRYADVCRVLREFRTFSSEHGNILTMLGKHDLASGKMLAVTDPPRHTEFKRQIHRYFTPTATEAFEPEVRALARRVLAPAASGEAFDFAAATAFYPIAFTALVMGIDPGDWGRLKRFAYVAIADQDPEVTEDEAATDALAQAHSEIFSYFVDEISRNNAARDDLTGAVARARTTNREFNDEEKIYNLYSVLLGATVTTSHAMNAGVLAFVEAPDQFTAWKDLGCTASLIEEVLRWSSPANHFMRHACHDTLVGDVLIRKGDAVTVWLGSANRDEEVFADPFRFDVQRTPNKHIAFGVGAHRCIGAPMARLALRVFFDEVHRHVERFELAGPVAHLASNFIAGVKRLPVRVILRPESRAEFANLPPLGRM